MAEESKEKSVAAQTAPAAPASVPTVDQILADPNSAAPVQIRRAKGARQVTSGVAHVDATFNNTRVVITDPQGNVLSWCTGGKLHYKGSRKSTSYVAQQIAGEAAKKAMMTYGLREVEVEVKGCGQGRESAVRRLAAVGLEITVLRDVTPLPHHGCRPPKKRRI